MSNVRNAELLRKAREDVKASKGYQRITALFDEGTFNEVDGLATVSYTHLDVYKRQPVNPMNFRNPKRDMAITALAGPVSNKMCIRDRCCMLPIFLNRPWGI